MLSNTYKRFILLLIAALFSWVIWQINIQLGNPCNTFAFKKCFVLSTTTFLIVYTPFEIYWSIRDLWYDRWIGLFLKELEILEVKISISDGNLSGMIIKNKNQSKIELKNSIVVICHGFSDTKETLQYFYYPLAYQGYVILVYDARGTGESKKTGHRSDFIKRIEDFNHVIKWIKSNRIYSKLKINCIGFSIGALTVLSGGFQNIDIEKIIAISSMSYYKQNIPRFNPIIILSYLLKGVKLFPSNEENISLSPYLIIEDVRNNIPVEKWKSFSKRVVLIHAKNDKVIKFRNFKENALILETSDENSLILRKGGHSQKKNELTLVGATLKFLNS
ncbi:MAG: alpha/beta fold hydrolase [Candidatus Thorarchaeota archaeon]